MDSARPRVLAVLPGFFPSTIIGVAKPLLRLHLQGHITLDLTLQFLAGRHAVARADVVVLCREIHPKFARVTAWAKQLGRPLVYEIDDNLIDVPPEIPGLDYLRRPAHRAAILDAIKQADIVRVYSESLRQLLLTYNPNVSLVSGPLDWSLVPPPPAKDATRVRLVYATSRQHDGIGQMLVRPLQRVLEQFEHAHLTIWGPRIASLSAHPRVNHLPFIRDYDQFFSRFAGEGFDVGLAPLPDDLFHRCKSNNKFREYASCGVAGVYSDMPVYNTCVVNGETGLLAGDSEDAWFDAIAQLVTDQGLRDRIAAAARQFARDHYNEAITDAEWLGALLPLARRPAPLAASHSAVPLQEPIATARGVVGHAADLASRVLPMLRHRGVRETWRGAQGHVAGIAQLTMWQLHKRRLERQARHSHQHS